MALSCFDDRAARPSEAEVRAALGPSGDLWFALIGHLSAQAPPILEEWAFSGAQYGWSLRLVHKKRRILYLIPQTAGFLVGVVLGDKAVAAANASSLPKSVLEEINGAKRYAEGRGVRLRVISPRDLVAIKTLADIKLERT
jgi:hypothetical protein